MQPGAIGGGDWGEASQPIPILIARHLARRQAAFLTMIQVTKGEGGVEGNNMAITSQAAMSVSPTAMAGPVAAAAW